MQLAGAATFDSIHGSDACIAPFAGLDVLRWRRVSRTWRARWGRLDVWGPIFASGVQLRQLQRDSSRQKRLGPRTLAQLLDRLPTSARKLCLDLSGSGLTDRGAVAIATALPSTLLELRLFFGQCKLQKDGCAALADALPQTLASLTLDLRECPLHQGGAVTLSAGIARLPCLGDLVLDFGGCGTRDEGAERIARHLPPSLRSLVLDFGGCHLTARAATALLTKCATLPSLHYLKIGAFGCPIVDFRIPTAFCPTLERLVLNFSGSGVGENMLHSLGCCLPIGLEQLDLTLIGTGVTNAGVASIAGRLPRLQSLGLDVSGCQVCSDGVLALMDKLPESLSHLSLGIAGCEVEDVGACGLTNWTSHLSTLKLDLNETRIHDTDLAQLLRKAHQLTRLSLNCHSSNVTCTNTDLVAALTNRQCMQDCQLCLDLTGCSLSEEGLRRVLAGLASSSGAPGQQHDIVHDQAGALSHRPCRNLADGESITPDSLKKLFDLYGEGAIVNLESD